MTDATKGSLRALARWLAALVVIGAAIAVYVFRERLFPPGRPTGEAAHEEHDDHHAHEGHGHENLLTLSPQAQKNIGLKLEKVAPKPFARTLSIPGVVVERPGITARAIPAPMTGVITKIECVQGETIEPGARLMEMRLTHEELVQAQGDLLRTAEELEIIEKEVARLKSVSESGAIAPKTLLERQYEQQKQQAVLRAQRQALLLHGLSESQIEGILKDHRLVQFVTVEAPSEKDSGGDVDDSARYHVQELRVSPGQHVTAGDTLAVLADHSSLLIEGDAFEKDIPSVQQAVTENWPVTATIDAERGAEPAAKDLRISLLSGRVEASRAFHFYVTLPNSVIRDTGAESDPRFINWRFKPGQRMQLHVPVEEATERIVLPVDAVAQDGAETYVFLPNGASFERRPVHVEHRDARFVVIANDGALFTGEKVVVAGAQQMQLALAAKSGGAIDPHAGHNH